MATQAVTTQQTDVSRITPAPGSVRALLESAEYKNRFAEVLGKRAPQFIASLNMLVYASKQLKECDPKTVIAAAIQAAALDLPIDPNLGFAYIIPYGKEAHFQAGWKTYVQLAHRTGQYRNINVTEIYAGEIKSVNRFTGLPVFGERTGDEVVGYLAYFMLVNGFEKYVYMTAEALLAHGKQYSKTFNRSDSKWKTDFPAMAKKTVIKQALSKWGPLSIEMKQVLAADVMPDEPAPVELTPEQRARYRAALFGTDDDGDEPTEAAPATDNLAVDREIVDAEKAKA